MKNLILLLAMCLVAKISFAKTVHPSIDDDLDFKMETDFRESDRGVAAFEKKEEAPKKEKSSDKKEESQKEQRDVASDEEVFDSTNENGIRYWKY
jgi:hypothetical protein